MNKKPMTDKVLDKLPLGKSPGWFKLFIAKILVRMLTLENAHNDIVLFNELNLWIRTNMRPTTSNPNYWINKQKHEQT